MRTKYPPLEHDTSAIGIEKHYKQFTDIQESLEMDTNMIFKKKFIKTYK